MDTTRNYLLARADFTLDRSQGGDRLTFKRWRRVLERSLPALLGCADRCDRVVVRLHYGEEQGRFTAWLRLPQERLPGGKRLRQIQGKLHARLEAILLPIGGGLVKLAVRRFRPKANAPAKRAILPLPREAGTLAS